MATWIRQSGTEIKLADSKDHEKFAESQGWKKKSKRKKKEVLKNGESGIIDTGCSDGDNSSSC